MSACSNTVSSCSQVPAAVVKLDRTWMSMSWAAASSTARGCRSSRTRGGELQHLLPADRGQLPRIRNDPRIRREHPGDVGEDLAIAQSQSRGDRHSRSVRTATAQRRDVTRRGDPLIAGHQDDGPGVEGIEDPLRAYVLQSRVAVAIVGQNPGLRAGHDTARDPRSCTADAASAHEMHSPTDNSASSSRSCGRDDIA